MDKDIGPSSNAFNPTKVDINIAMLNAIANKTVNNETDLNPKHKKNIKATKAVIKLYLIRLRLFLCVAVVYVFLMVLPTKYANIEIHSKM